MRSCAGFLLALMSLTAGRPAFAQETHEPDNGTNPAKLRRSAAVLFEHLDLRGDASRGTLKLQYEQPIGAKTSVRLQVPAVRDTQGDQSIKDEFRRGDIALRLNYIHDVNRERGIVFQGELTTDTASSPELGNGKTVFKGTFIYAMFLPGGDIFGPSFGQSNSIGGDPTRPKINNLVVDFYYVPKLSDRRYFVTLDPAVTLDWENSTQFASFAVTLGRVLGPAFGGTSQVYVKPSGYMGGYRTADWAIEVGLKVIGF
jgi:hypothetical protein